MSDVLLIDNSIQQETVLVPVTTVQPDLVTQTDVVVYVPLASKTAHGVVKIGEGIDITSSGVLNIVLTKRDIGLENVDNTSDLDKPISNATQKELSRIQGLIKGSENAVSYESYEALVNEFNILGPDVYNVGQSVFIATLNVPDLWVYGVEEEFEEFTYIDDSTIESILNIDGTFKVGYYRLAALDTLKVDLSNYVTTQVLDLKLENVAYKEDLPKEYVKIASVTDNTLTLQNQDGTEVVFESKEPDLSGYLPITGGTISRSSIAPLKIETGSTSASLIAFGNKIAQQEGEEPVTTLLGYLGVSAQKEPVFNDLRNNIVLAYKKDLSSITDITSSSDSATLTIIKRNGSSFEFKGAGSSINEVYPIGAIYLSVNETSPASLFGGVWEKIEDRFLLASGSSYLLGETGGSADAVIVSHRHQFTVRQNAASGSYTTIPSMTVNSTNTTAQGNTTTVGESGVGKNMPPYLVVNVWKRVA